RPMLPTAPHGEDDGSGLYAAVAGQGRRGELRSMQHAAHTYPLVVGGVTMRAIQTCTAAPLVECARLLLSCAYAGIVTQSQLEPAAILHGSIVRQAYHTGVLDA